MGENDHVSILQCLLDHGADIDPRNKKGLTPLHCAVIYRNSDEVELLLQYGADINAKSCLKRTALHFAISNHQHDQWKRTLPLQGTGPDESIINKLLVHENLSIDKGDIRGDTPLMWAVMEKHPLVVNVLLSKGANPSSRNKDSFTPLHIALSAEDPCHEVVLLLLMFRASLICADKEGKTPIDILIQNVTNSQSLGFACMYMKAIALSYNVKKNMMDKLECISQLSQHLENCCREVQQMKKDTVFNLLTLFDFFMKDVEEFDFITDPVFQAYKPVVMRLLAGLYPNYARYILKKISKSGLCTLFETIICTKDCKDASGARECKDLSATKKCTKINPVELFSNIDILLCMSMYLSKLDVFNLIVAFSKGKICVNI